VICRRFEKPCISSGGGREFCNSLMSIKAPKRDGDPLRSVTALAVRRFAGMRIATLAIVCGLLVAACSGCGSSHPKSAAPSAAQIAKAFRGSPAKLVALHRQANRLIGGKKSDFEAQMAALKGYPVVVNKWAAWCGPCRGEFPVFQKAGLDLGKKVAFVGVDGQDNDGDARKFLKQYPVTYPSYRDPDLKISTSIQAGIAFPTTIFFNRSGKLVYAHPGPYTKVSQLVADIRRYAL
jgi:thiol-disulfide isomerase/thioredoxin